MKTKTLAYHFLAAGSIMRDGRKAPRNGVWLKHKGPVEICKSGLHYSLDAFDTLQYAPGPICTLVEVEDIVSTQNDKGVCRRRKIVARFDATKLLRYFARMQALSVLDNWQESPSDVVLEWLLTGNESLRSAARSAAWSAAESAAESAARSAALSAAESAARSAAESAARSAAWSAAESAARSAAELAARIELNSLINAEFEAMGAL